MFKDTSFPHFREDRAITKDSNYLQNMDKLAPLDRQVRYLTGQAKVHDLKKHIDPVRCLLSNRVDQLVYKPYDLTCLRAYTHRQAPEEIAIVEVKK